MDRDRLDVIVFADPARALFAQGRSDALDICENESLAPTAAYKRVKNNSFKKRQAEGIGREGGPPPWVSGDQLKWCQHLSDGPRAQGATIR